MSEEQEPPKKAQQKTNNIDPKLHAACLEGDDYLIEVASYVPLVNTTKKGE